MFVFAASAKGGREKDAMLLYRRSHWRSLSKLTEPLTVFSHNTESSAVNTNCKGMKQINSLHSSILDEVIVGWFAYV